MITARASIILLALPVVLAGCGGSTDAGKTITVTTALATTAPTTSTSSTQPVSPKTMSLVVYRVRNGTLQPERVQVPSTTGVATAALGALDLAAPVTVASGTARVDRPASTPREIAEIVYTLTRFPTILRVDIAGRTSVTRDEVARFVAPILVDLPIAGDRFEGAVTGTASVFEANLVVELVQGGKKLSMRTVTASEGAPARGTFATQLDTSSGAPGAAATVVVFSPSAVDGSQQHRVDVPVTLR